MAEPIGATPVTVTVVNYNGAAFLGACLDHLAALRGEIAEVIVVDNASTDGSLELARAHPVAPRVVALDSNDGPCVARNRGLAEARTRWVFQVDSDVLVEPDVLEKLLPELADPEVVVVQPRAVLANDPAVVHYDGGRMHYVGVMCLDNLLQRVDGDAGPANDVDAVISMALLLDARLVLDIGAYDEAFFILFEDHDLSYRLRARGLRLRRVPRARVLHDTGTEGLSFRPGAAAYPDRRAFLHARNRAYLVLKNYSWRAMILSWPGRCVYALVWLVFAASRGVLGGYIRGRIDLLRHVPRALRLRRQLAGQRRLGDRRLLGADALTFSPVIDRRGMEAGLERVLNAILRGWWRLVSVFLPRSAGPTSGSS
ncbi:MAG: hypothetical protein DHS20C15_22890 [Planctomycetota bacterium]|nr:MAG: hypothetical protein DHS20C15_22890 [Planctomycetota bacterium]